MWAKWIYQKLYKNGRRILRYGIRRSTPFVDWVPELRDTSVLRADFVSGVTVALVLVPQSMAYAQLAGLPTYYGLYASFLPVIVASLFGSSRQLATGPVAVISLLTASALEPIAASGSDGYIAYAIMLALMVGVFQLILGMLKMGMLVDFLSHPVVIGFTNAAALIIATSQLSKLLGVDAVRGDAHYETVWNVLVAAYHHLHLPTVAMSIIAIGLMLLLPKIWRRLPPILVAAVLTTVGSWAIGFEANFGGRIVGSIPQGLPAFSMPELDVAVMLDLLGVAVAISLIGFMEAYSIAKAVSMRKTRQELDPNQELVGQGLSNIVASLFQGYAVSGSFSRTAVNMEAGGRTGFSSVVTGLVVGATLLFLTPMLYYMPQAMLASVIIMAVIPLVRVKPILYAWKVQKHDAVVSVLTFVLTLVWAPHLEQGIIVGVLFSLGLFVYRTMHPHVYRVSRNHSGNFADAGRQLLETCCTVAIVRFEGPLFFANISYFVERVLRITVQTPGLRYIIIDAVGINEIDATGEYTLHSLSKQLVDSNVAFLVARANTDVMDIFKRTGFAGDDWLDQFTATREQALEFAFARIGMCANEKPCGCSKQKCPLLDKHLREMMPVKAQFELAEDKA